MIISMLACLGTSWAATPSPEPGAQGNYFVLSAGQNQPPPFGSVSFTRGRVEKIGAARYQWWQLEVRKELNFEGTPMLTVRALTQIDPLVGPTNVLHFQRYQLKLPATGEWLEYRDIHTQRALLPGWADFERQFLPRSVPGCQMQSGLPETAAFLGHILTLHHARTNAAWEPWPEPKLLELDPELLIGSSRPVKDREGHRLPQTPQRQDYQYVPLIGDDYRIMIAAGMNLFTINPNQEAWVRSEPVFYLRGADGAPPLRYPADLFRANYLGPEMFMDEPSIIMVGDTNVHRTLRYFSDVAALIEKRTRRSYDSDTRSSVWLLEKTLRGQDLNLGDLRIKQVDLPSWETLYDTTYYQMRGGGMGIVHEGRYQLPEFDAAVERFTDQPRAHTAAELLQYYYAFLRGGTRPFHKFWGTAIYGQCDTNIAPLALTLAYDMGARYLWFWTSDHDHHVPWPEQLALARTLRAHEKAHPRGSILTSPPKVDVALAIPYGYFLSFDNLWWVRVLDKEGKNEASQKYRRLMRRAFEAAQDCYEHKLSYDFVVDDGQIPKGYRKVIHLTDSP